ncbi:hypothetical protein ACFV0O_03820 [Kitasatospora sp. NPDC059577]|uniref:hypothetical protein n=1 Tax=unclassified Kitasatospora TaxID=2633591 RepID=UPI0036CA67AE
MDPAALAALAGSSLVGAMATDAWEHARDGVVAVWRRFRPDRAELVGEDLAELRREVLVAEEQDDEPLREALAADWQQRLSELLRRQPELAGELERVLDDVLTPSLPAEARTRVYKQTNVAHGNGRAFGVQDGNLIYHEGKGQGGSSPEGVTG